MRACVHVCVCACVCECVTECVRACLHVCVCVCGLCAIHSLIASTAGHTYPYVHLVVMAGE